jgi:hypothetical protein
VDTQTTDWFTQYTDGLNKRDLLIEAARQALRSAGADPATINPLAEGLWEWCLKQTPDRNVKAALVIMREQVEILAKA